MASNIKYKEIDVTKVGPQSYRDLQKANEAAYQSAASESIFANIRNPRSYVQPSDLIYEGGEHSSIYTQSGGRDYYGNSMFDNSHINEEEFRNLSDIRAENQPWYAQIGAGLAKGAILAGTTFLDGTLGLIFGAGTAMNEGRWSGLWDNDFSKAMQSVNEWSEEALPNYYTRAEQEQPWYENIFTANFLGDKLIKNLGFTVGAFYSGNLGSSILGGGIKALQATTKGAKLIGKGSNLAQSIGIIKEASQFPAVVTSSVGAALSAVNEGRIEALNNSKDWFELHKAQLDDKFGVMNGDTSHLSDTELGAYNQVLGRLNEDRLKMGNADLLLNLPVLLASNVVQFSKLYANGFRTARKTNNIIERAGEYATNTTKSGSALAITKGALSEGLEEMAQGAASRIAGNYYSTDVNNFYKSKASPEAAQETLDWLKSFANGINETVNDGSVWEEFLIGSLTGALGMPRFRGIRNSEGKLQSPITIEEGAINKWRDYNGKIARENEIANYMNSRISSPEFKNYYQGLIRHNKYQNDMNRAAEEGDEFNFKNAEHAQLVSDIVMFDNAGKIEDLKTLISEAYDTSDENLSSIVENTTTVLENGNLIGPFAQYAIKNADNTISTNFGNEASKQEMINKLTQNRDDILNTIEQYQKVKDSIDINTGQQLSDDQLEELTWMKSQIGNWSERSTAMSKDIKESLGKVIANLNAALNYNISIRNAEGAGNIERTELYDKANSNVLNLQHNIRILESTRNLPDEELAFLLTTNPKFIEQLNKEIDDIDSSIMSEEDKQGTKLKLDDINKLGNASKMYSKKLTEYLKNPSKQVEDHIRADNQTVKKSIDNQIDNMSTPEMVKSMENGDLDFNGMDLNFNQSDLDILNGTNTEATDEEIKNAERKAKASNAKKIVNTKERAKEQAKLLSESDAQYDEIAAMLDEASTYSNTPEELLDLDTEVFNNPSSLITSSEEEDMARELQEGGYNPQEIEEAILDSKYQRNDEIKGILQQIKANLSNEDGELMSLPSPDDPSNVVIREFGDTKSVDSTGKSEVVNSDVQDSNSKDSDITTPYISQEEVLSSAMSGVNDTNEIKGYWKPNTTELPIHRNNSNNDPYYMGVKDPMTKALYKTIYDFLLENNVFGRINNNEVKRGQKVKFAFSKSLTSSINKAVSKDIPILLLIDENNNIIGDLANPYDINVFKSFEGLSELYKEAITYAKEHSNDNTDDLIIIPNKESTINRNYVGRPKFAPDANDTKNFSTLNTIAGGRPFKLSIALTSSPNPTMIMEPGRRKVQGLTVEEMKIIPSYTAKAGQPFMLIETSDERRKYYPVPIIMPLLGSANKNSSLYRKMKSLLSKLDMSTLSNPDSILKFKDRIKELIAVDDLYIEVIDSKDVPNIAIRIKRLSTDTSWDTIYKGILDADSIMEGFENAYIPYQISRKYINSTFEGSSYNNMVGELAQANLEVGALHTVNDFFTINPIIEGEPKKATTIKDSEKVMEEAMRDKNRKSAVNFVEKVIIPAQGKIDRAKTDKDYYFIKEGDGKYYKYERVHKLLPSNFSGSSRYGNRSLVVGSEVDSVIRDYFNTGKTVKPEHLSEEAYTSLLGYLSKLSQWIRSNNYTIFANNLVLHHKYPDGRRIAGEVDLLLVDNEGNYLIYDIKTSAYSFYSPTFDNVQPQWGQQISTSDYYANQLSSYATLLKDEYGRSTSKVALIPFVLDYDKSNPMQVNSLVHEKNRPLPLKDVTVFFNQASSDNGTTAMEDFEKALSGLEGDKKTNALIKQEGSTNVLSREESLQRIKSTKLFRTPQRKALLSKLEDNILSDIATMREPILKAKLSKLDALIKPNMPEGDLNNLVKNTLTSPLNRLRDTDNIGGNNLNREIRRVRKLLPQLSNEEAIILRDTIIKTPTGYAWGQFKNGIITLYKKAAKGTAYHEAFHYVFNMLIDDKDIKQAYNAAKHRWGNLDAVELEEKMAEDFRGYMQDNESFLKRVWHKLKSFINKLRGKENYLDDLYHNISKGAYSNTKPNTSNTVKYKELTKEDIQAVVDTRVNNHIINRSRVSVNNAWGKLKDSMLAQGYDIKGYYNSTKKGYVVTSVRFNPIVKQANDIRYYHMNKLEYGNLSVEQREYLSERNISIETFNNMTLEEKEILFECLN